MQQEHLPEGATTKSCLWLWFVTGLIVAPVDSTFGAVELRVKSGPDSEWYSHKFRRVKGGTSNYSSPTFKQHYIRFRAAVSNLLPLTRCGAGDNWAESGNRPRRYARREYTVGRLVLMDQYKISVAVGSFLVPPVLAFPTVVVTDESKKKAKWFVATWPCNRSTHKIP